MWQAREKGLNACLLGFYGFCFVPSWYCSANNLWDPCDKMIITRVSQGGRDIFHPCAAIVYSDTKSTILSYNHERAWLSWICTWVWHLGIHKTRTQNVSFTKANIKVRWRTKTRIHSDAQGFPIFPQWTTILFTEPLLTAHVSFT